LVKKNRTPIILPAFALVFATLMCGGMFQVVHASRPCCLCKKNQKSRTEFGNALGVVWHAALVSLAY